MAEPIVIVEYRPRWAQEFKQLEAQLHELLGALALSIDHIGSTAVPGLAAKDVIDIQISVADLSDDSALKLLVAAGFNHQPQIRCDSLVGLSSDDAELAKRFLREIPGSRRAHLHLRERGRLNQQYPLLMRDFLRAQPQVAQAYATIKRELAQRFADDSGSYYAIKDPYMDSLYYAALLWHDSDRPQAKIA